MKKVVAVLFLLVGCMPFISLAHPGHGETGGFTITHYFTEPIHLMISFSVLLGLYAFSRYLRYNKKQKENN